MKCSISDISSVSQNLLPKVLQLATEFFQPNFINQQSNPTLFEAYAKFISTIYVVHYNKLEKRPATEEKLKFIQSLKNVILTFKMIKCFRQPFSYSFLITLIVLNSL